MNTLIKRINLLAGMALALSVADPGPSGGRSHAAGGRGNRQSQVYYKERVVRPFSESAHRADWRAGASAVSSFGRIGKDRSIDHWLCPLA